MIRLLLPASMAVLLAACSTEAPPPPGPVGNAGAVATEPVASEPVDLVDPLIAPATAGEDGWNYRLSTGADLSGDGTSEQVVLTARVELVRGRPAWDDGQPWQVYVEESDGTRTRLYAQRLQLGTLSMRVTVGDSLAPATVVLLEELPDRLSVYEATYRGPGDATVVAAFVRQVDPVGDSASPRLP
jgi:hypothetical protein